MALEMVTLRLIGDGPMLMHNSRLANPLNPYTKVLKKLTGKRQKTDADHWEISRIEWEGSLYLHDGIVIIPGTNIEACMLAGAKKSKRGVKIQSGIHIKDDYIPMEYSGPKIVVKNGNNEIPNSDLDLFYEKLNFQHMVKVEKNRCLRTRPIFHNWKVEFSLYYDTTVIEADEILKVMVDAGKLVGLGDWRPRFGRFEVEMI